MKNLIILFAFMLLASTAQSQSLTEKDLTGTWQVVAITDAGTNPAKADEMNAAYFDLYPDHSFQLRTQKNNGASTEYEENFKNYKWSYNAATQTINLSKGSMNIKASKSNNNVFFELTGTGMKLEVFKPI
ncbi:MAG: hypothetical protein JJE55_07810 [Flavobacteriaceae bacterium]|nr:hypothetical protein [Flavobacteriaceae bacterium]